MEEQRIKYILTMVQENLGLLCTRKILYKLSAVDNFLEQWLSFLNYVANKSDTNITIPTYYSFLAAFWFSWNILCSLSNQQISLLGTSISLGTESVLFSWSDESSSPLAMVMCTFTSLCNSMVYVLINRYCSNILLVWNFHIIYVKNYKEKQKKTMQRQ